MKAWTVHQAAGCIKVSERTLRALVRQGEVSACPGTGGQGREWAFDPAHVRTYALNQDLADLLARALLAFPNIPPQAASAWGAQFDNATGRRIRKTLHARLTEGPAGLRPVSAGRVTLQGRKQYIDHDALRRRCRRLARSLPRRKVEYLIAALVASAAPRAEGSRRQQGVEQISMEAVRRKAGEWQGGLNVRRFSRDFRLWLARVGNRALPLIHHLAAASTWEALPSNIRALWEDFNAYTLERRRVRYRWETVRRWFAPGIDRGRKPPAAAVGRLLGLKRARAAQVMRELREQAPAWFWRVFRE